MTVNDPNPLNPPPLPLSRHEGVRVADCMKKEDVLLVIGALDTLAIKLARYGHCWTEGEREIYEQSIQLLEREINNE